MHRRRWIDRAVAAAVLAGVGLAGALSGARADVAVEGVRFQERLPLGGQSLVLNGTGVRAVAWIKGYAAALYLGHRVHTADEAVAQPGPKRLRMVMLMGAPSGEFIKAFDKGMTRNTSETEAAALRERMARFDAMLEGLGRVAKGDIVDLDFVPGQGMTLNFNGKACGPPIAGADFYAALLRTFVGERPYDKRLRDGLLGVPG